MPYCTAFEYYYERASYDRVLSMRVTRSVVYFSKLTELFSTRKRKEGECSTGRQIW